MVNASLNWKDHVSDDFSLWSFAVKHWVWIYNCVLNSRSGLSPFALITKKRSNYRDILHCHVWGCLVYVFETKLQNDQNLPKWNRRTCLGQFVRFLDEHSYMVANVCHLTTRYISPQFHVVFDNLFETVNCTGVDDWAIKSICNGLFSVIVNCMLKMNLTRLVISFTNHLPYMRFDSMKLDDVKETKIISVSAVKK
jgi:hypothetical protein